MLFTQVLFAQVLFAQVIAAKLSGAYYLVAAGALYGLWRLWKEKGPARGEDPAGEERSAGEEGDS